MPSIAQGSRSLLLTYLTPQRRHVATLAAMLLGSIGLQLVNPQVLQRFLDSAHHPEPAHYVLIVAGIFLAVAVVQQVLAVVSVYLSELVAWTATNELRADLAFHCLKLDLSFHKARTPGELIERIDGDVTAMANFFSQFVIQIAGNVLLLLGILAALYLLDWRAGLVLTVFAAVTLGVMLRLRAIAVPHWRAARQASADLFGFLEERLGGAEDLRANGAVAYVMRRLYQHTRHRLVTTRRARLIGGMGWAAPMLLIALGTGAAFWIAGALFHRGLLGVGGAFIVYYYTQMLVRPLNVISFQIDDFQKASAGIIRVQELLAIRSELADGLRTLPATGALGVAFEGASFGYGEDDMVLHDLSFVLRPGETLGLLGRTGSGKTTVARLLFRLYDPAAGRILLDGVDLRALRRAAVRERVGMVTQDVQLFRASVRDNLTLFDETIGDDRLRAALADLGLDAWLRSLPDGLDTLLETGGGNLSAGEAQLLAFTRVFLRDPGLVILDEASSRLDPVTERRIERAIDTLLRGRTAIIIAHRLRTLERVDQILALEQGRLREQGPREHLTNDPQSYYARLLRAGAAEAQEVLA